jgi:hypothetical protein
MMILGIDPGLSGACALLLEGKFYAVFDLPVARDHKRSWIDGRAFANTLGVGEFHAYIEAVHAMPKQGVSSAFQFGTGLGSIIGALQALYIPVQFITPNEWKKALNLSRDKDASLHRARQMFPAAELHLKKHEGRAEALLIAHFAYWKYHRKE